MVNLILDKAKVGEEKCDSNKRRGIVDWLIGIGMFVGMNLASLAFPSLAIAEESTNPAQNQLSDDAHAANYKTELSTEWKFAFDPENVGKNNGWYKPGFDDSDWTTAISEGKGWNRQRLAEEYVGAAWYRQSFEVPDFVSAFEHVYLAFLGVDENARVYVNGKFVREHSTETTGLEPEAIWDMPFVVEVGHLLVPDDEATVAVRVTNTKGDGGIHRPVWLCGSNSELKDREIADFIAGRSPLKVTNYTDADDLPRGQKLLLKHGFQLQALVRHLGFSDIDLWHRSNFTAMKVFFSRSFYDTFWPEDDNFVIDTVLPEDIDWAFWTYNNEMPKEGIENLVGIQYHDEQKLSDKKVMDRSIRWMQQARDAFPDAIRFINQWGGESSDEALREFIERGEPDMICYGNYPYRVEKVGDDLDFVPSKGSITEYAGRSFDYLDRLLRFRRLGLERGVPYGQWIQGFQSGGGDGSDWDYMFEGEKEWMWRFPSESEIRLEQFLAWALGYKYGIVYYYNPREDLNFDVLMFEDDRDAVPNDTQPSKGFWQMSEAVGESVNIGKSLVGLLNTDIWILPGEHAKGVGTGAWKDLPEWSEAKAMPIENIEVENPSGDKGDVFVGYFIPIIDDENVEHDYFMIVNGLTEHPYVKNKNKEWEYDPGKGLSEDTEQKIKITFDFSGTDICGLKRVSRQTGKVESVELEQAGENIYILEFVLPGGTGDLFAFDTGRLFAGENNEN